MADQQNKMADQLSAEQLAEFKAAFNLMDRDGDGAITAADLGEAFKAAGLIPTAAWLDDIIAKVDADGDGVNNVDEFLTMMARTMAARGWQDQSGKEMMITQFKQLDTDKDGYITLPELRNVITSNLGEVVAEEELEAMFKAADVNNDDQVDYEEFVKMIVIGALDFSVFLTMIARKKEAEEKEEMLRRAFRLMDKHGDGYISTAELRHAMTTNLGDQLTDQELDEMIADAYVEEDGLIRYEEFVKLIVVGIGDVSKTYGVKSFRKWMRQTFKQFDMDGDKKISAEELYEVLSKQFGQVLTVEQLGAIIQRADMNQDGEINFREFINQIVYVRGKEGQFLCLPVPV